jgi:hypothetical protein
LLHQLRMHKEWYLQYVSQKIVIPRLLSENNSKKDHAFDRTIAVSSLLQRVRTTTTTVASSGRAKISKEV